MPAATQPTVILDLSKKVQNYQKVLTHLWENVKISWGTDGMLVYTTMIEDSIFLLPAMPAKPNFNKMAYFKKFIILNNLDYVIYAEDDINYFIFDSARFSEALNEHIVRMETASSYVRYHCTLLEYAFNSGTISDVKHLLEYGYQIIESNGDIGRGLLKYTGDPFLYQYLKENQAKMNVEALKQCQHAYLCLWSSEDKITLEELQGFIQSDMLQNNISQSLTNLVDKSMTKTMKIFKYIYTLRHRLSSEALEECYKTFALLWPGHILSKSCLIDIMENEKNLYRRHIINTYCDDSDYPYKNSIGYNKYSFTNFYKFINPEFFIYLIQKEGHDNLNSISQEGVDYLISLGRNNWIGLGHSDAHIANWLAKEQEKKSEYYDTCKDLDKDQLRSEYRMIFCNGFPSSYL